MGKKWQKAKWSGIVYCATNRLNGHRYVGVTCQLLCQRKGAHFNQALRRNSQTHFHRAVRKYGKENFSFEIMETHSSYDEALKAEIKIIETTKPEYNMTPGGEGYIGFVLSEDQRQRLSDALKGKAGYWTKETLPESFYRGRAEWNDSAAGKSSWDKFRQLGPKAAAKPVICLDDGLVFPHAVAAAAHYKLSPTAIHEVCHRRKYRLTVSGLVFRFLGEPHGGQAEAASVRQQRLESRRRTGAIARAALRKKYQTKEASL